jgi:hypothetical protein
LVHGRLLAALGYPDAARDALARARARDGDREDPLGVGRLAERWIAEL